MPAYNFIPSYQQYNPNYYQPYQPSMVPTGPTVPAVTNVQTPQSSIIWISGDKEAAMYPVAPNNAVTLWSQSEPVVYLKQADASGKPTLKTYDLVERTETVSNQNETSDYATKADLASVTGIVKDLNSVIGSLRSDVDAMKGDVYGLAGRKKTTKKQGDDD